MYTCRNRRQPSIYIYIYRRNIKLKNLASCGEIKQLSIILLFSGANSIAIRNFLYNTEQPLIISMHVMDIYNHDHKFNAVKVHI